MKRLGVVLLLACFALPLALPSAAGAPRVRGQRDDRDRDRHDLAINRALYGAGKKVHDITAVLNADVHDGRLRIPVTNDTMGGDPARNKPKTLQVWYTYNGRQFQVTLNENQFLDLPGPEAFPEHHDER